MNFSVDEVAEKLNVGPETVRRWIRNGELNATRFGGRRGYKISETDLNDFLNNRNSGNDISVLDDLDSNNILSLIQNTFNEEGEGNCESTNIIMQKYLLKKEIINIDEMILKLQKQRNEIQTKLEILNKYTNQEDNDV